MISEYKVTRDQVIHINPEPVAKDKDISVSAAGELIIKEATIEHIITCSNKSISARAPRWIS